MGSCVPAPSFAPVCSTYSLLAASKHQRVLANNYLGVTQACYDANADLVKIYDFLIAALKQNPKFVFVIENPATGAMQYHPLIRKMMLSVEDGGLGATQCEVHFCFFCERGKEVNKPTHFWTNSKNLINTFGTVDKTHCAAPSPRYICGANGNRCRSIAKRGVPRAVTERFASKDKKAGVATKEITAYPHGLAVTIGQCLACDVGVN